MNTTSMTRRTLLAASLLGASGLTLYRRVVLPAALPEILTGMRLAWAFAWRSLLGAELILVVQHHGLGFLLENLPPQVHLVIATRADPPLPLSRLRERGDDALVARVDERSREVAEHRLAVLAGAPQLPVCV